MQQYLDFGTRKGTVCMVHRAANIVAPLRISSSISPLSAPGICAQTGISTLCSLPLGSLDQHPYALGVFPGMRCEPIVSDVHIGTCGVEQFHLNGTEQQAQRQVQFRVGEPAESTRRFQDTGEEKSTMQRMMHGKGEDLILCMRFWKIMTRFENLKYIMSLEIER